ncbi:MAG: hypothetical protein KBB29_09855 [Bacteroidales bacterium]|jgi:hypothetical protein|nr:hypothetical protein [Bacteroidales bacterium]MBP8644115.1 hypothetical protein [Bacteroidales bacterium]
MRYISIIAIMVSLITISCKTKINPSLNNYVSHIEREKCTAKDYIIRQWDKKDIVILCERYHGEMTQYDLIFDIIKSDYFIDNVGSIFTEVGSVSVQKELNAFLLKEYSDSIKQYQDLIKIYRNITWPYWEKSNFFFLLKKINQLNSTLPNDKKIKVYTSDFINPKFLETKTKEDFLTYRKKQLFRDRDSVMAENIIHVYDSLYQLGKNKCLVIMNYRHAFLKNILSANGALITNTGAVLNNNYKNKVASVYINSLALTTKPIDTTKNVAFQDYCDVPIQDGKWDAAFKILKKENLGFDFKDNQFGIDSLDIWPFSKQYTYQDIFTGMVYYLPITKHFEAYGLEGFVDSIYVDELYRRLLIFNAVYGGEKVEKADLIKSFEYEEMKYEGLDRLETQINKWMNNEH